MPEQTTADPDRSRFYDEVLDAETWRELAEAAAKIDWSVLAGPRTTPYRPPSREALDEAIAYAISRLPVHMEPSGRKPPPPEELAALAPAVRTFLHEIFETPKIDLASLRQTTEFAQLRVSRVGGDLVLAAAGAPGFILADVRGGGTIEIAGNHVPKTDLEKAAFAVDILLEVFGLVLGFIGLNIGGGAAQRKAVHDAVKELLKQPGVRDAFRKLLKALKDGDIVEVFRFLEFLEQTGNLGELWAHLFAGLGWLDYALTLVKFVAWIVAALGSGGAATALKFVELAAGLAGLGNKLYHAEEFV